MSKPVVGKLARMMKAIPVKRPQDYAFAGIGKIESAGDDRIHGVGSQFAKQVQQNDSIRLPKGDIVRVLKVVSDTELIVESQVPAFDASAFKILPKIDQNEIYAKVHDELHKGRCVGIFPEGGSHDRPELLPLKAGVCLMALGAMVKYNIPVAIQCVGLNYFQGHKFRSRVAVNFGITYNVPRRLAELYASDRKAAIAELLTTIEVRMKDVWVTAPSYEELSLVFLARRVYRPLHVTLSEEEILKLNHLFGKGYAFIREKYGNPPEVESCIEALKVYDHMLESFGVRDADLRLTHFSSCKFVLYSLVSLLLVVISVAVALPGLIVSVFPGLYLRFKAETERKKALAGSVVKITGSDVMASIKVTGGMAIFPLVTAFIAFGFIAANYYYDNDLATALLKSFLMTVVWPMYFYICIIFGDTAVKHSRRLYLRTKSIFSKSELRALHAQRKVVQSHVRDLVDKYGPELVPNFAAKRILRPDLGRKRKIEDVIGEAFSLLEEIV